MAPRKKATTLSKVTDISEKQNAQKIGTRELTLSHQSLLEVQQGLVSLSSCKPRNHEAILIIARGIAATQKALKPFEKQKETYIKSLPKQPAPDAPQDEQDAWKQHQNDTHEKFTALLNAEVTVTFPPALTNAMLLHFQEHVNPLDLVRLDPYMVEL